MARIVESNLFGQVKTPMRFWSNTKLLNANRRQCKDTQPYYLLTPSHYIQDFQIVRPHRFDAITKFQLQYEDGTVVIDSIAGPGSLGGVNIRTIGTKDYITYKGRIVVSSTDYTSTQPFLFFNDNVSRLDCDKIYRIVLGDGVDEWVSEPFKGVNARFDELTDLFEGAGRFPDPGDNGWVTDSGTWQFNTLLSTPNHARKMNYGEVGKISYTIDPSFNNYFLGGCWAKFRIYLSGITYNSAGNQDVNIYYDGVLIGTVPGGSGNGTYEFVGQFPGSSTGTITIEFQTNVRGNVMSEIFPITDELDCHLKLSWSNPCDIFNMFNTFEAFDNLPLQNEFFLPEDTELGKPAYKATIEGSENGDRTLIPAFKKREKRYFLELGEAVPEHIVDALFDMQFFEDVYLYSKHGIGLQKINDIDVSYEWAFDEQCDAKMSMTFGFDDDGVETGCCDNFDTSGIIPVQVYAAIPDVPFTVSREDIYGNPTSLSGITTRYLFYKAGDTVTFGYTSPYLGHSAGNDGGGIALYVRVTHSVGPDDVFTSATNSIELTIQPDSHYYVSLGYDVQTPAGDVYPPIFGVITPPVNLGDTGAIDLTIYAGLSGLDFDYLWTLPDLSTVTTRNIAGCVPGVYTCEITFTGADCGCTKPAGWPTDITQIPFTLSFVVPSSIDSP